ncbi:hypothetical protein Hanom_Chr02g00154881 [Helianthus anomalus]
MLFCWQLILKGIDKREILSSGAPQITKEGSGGVNAVEGQSRRSKLIQGIHFYQGMQGYFGNSSSVLARATKSGDNLFQLAKLMQLERQK